MKKLLFLLALVLILSGCNSGATDGVFPSRDITASATLPTNTSIPTEEPTLPPTEEAPVMHIPATAPLAPQDSDIVRVRDYIPDVMEELFYATENNFTGSVIYDFQDVYLRYGSVKKLMAVQEELHRLGLGIKIWDGFRPVSAQFKLWEICPDDTYVANPNKGYSNHSRGFAVDLTLVDSNGNELEMPTAFDDFSGKADRNYSDVSESAKNNSLLLESIMHRHGFQGYSGEWWHYNDTTRYEVEHTFDPNLISCWQVIGEESLSLLQSASADSSSLARLEPGEIVTVMGTRDKYVLVCWEGIRGYLESPLLLPA